MGWAPLPNGEGFYKKSMSKNSSDASYVKKTGDAMTGPLTITPSSGDTSVVANKDVTIKAGQKLNLDG